MLHIFCEKIRALGCLVPLLQGMREGQVRDGWAVGRSADALASRLLRTFLTPSRVQYNGATCLAFARFPANQILHIVRFNIAADEPRLLLRILVVLCTLLCTLCHPICCTGSMPKSPLGFGSPCWPHNLFQRSSPNNLFLCYSHFLFS